MYHGFVDEWLGRQNAAASATDTTRTDQWHLNVFIVPLLQTRGVAVDHLQRRRRPSTSVARWSRDVIVAAETGVDVQRRSSAGAIESRRLSSAGAWRRRVFTSGQDTASRHDARESTGTSRRRTHVARCKGNEIRQTISTSCRCFSLGLILYCACRMGYNVCCFHDCNVRVTCDALSRRQRPWNG